MTHLQTYVYYVTPNHHHLIFCNRKPFHLKYFHPKQLLLLYPHLVIYLLSVQAKSRASFFYPYKYLLQIMSGNSYHKNLRVSFYCCLLKCLLFRNKLFQHYFCSPLKPSVLHHRLSFLS